MYVFTKTMENTVITAIGAGVTTACVYYYYFYSPKIRKKCNFQHEKLKNFLNSKSLKGIQGLENGYNYCYMNVILQCHASSPLFNQWLHHFYYQTNQRSMMISELLYIIKKINTKKQTSETLSGFNILSYISGQVNFQDMMQHDALEFYEELQNAFNKLHKYYSFKKFVLNCFNFISSNSNILTKYKNIPKIVTPLGQIELDNVIPISPNLGVSMTKITCSECNHYEMKSDSFSYISLPIISSDMSTCLSKYFANEHLDMYKCDNCQSVDKCNKQFKILTLPRLLVIHFQRLTWTNSGLIKITEQVLFPSTIFMDRFLLHRLDPNRLVKSFRLVGVVVHVGNEVGGHYINYRLSIDDRKWFRISDENCNEVSFNNVHNSTGYILFYEKNF